MPTLHLPPPPPNAVAEALTAAGFAPAVLLFKLDQSAGLAILYGVNGQVGLLRWSGAAAHLDAGALLDAIVWDAPAFLVPLAEEAEEALGFAGVPDVPLISIELRAMRGSLQPS